MAAALHRRDDQEQWRRDGVKNDGRRRARLRRRLPRDDRGVGRRKSASISRTNGGEHFAALPCLNDSDIGMTVLQDIVRRELAGLGVVRPASV